MSDATSPVLLDTHVWRWLLLGDERLGSSQCLTGIEEAAKRSSSTGRKRVMSSRIVMLMCLVWMGLGLARAQEGRQVVRLSPEDVCYESGRGRLRIAVHARDGTEATPMTVAVVETPGGHEGKCVIHRVKQGLATCSLEWPRSPVGTGLRVAVTARGADKPSCVAELTMGEALTNAAVRFQRVLHNAKSTKLDGPGAMVFEAEDFPTRHDARIEQVKGASGGKAVRMLSRKSFIERKVEVQGGVYVFGARAMAMAGDQDALNVRFGGVKQRGHLTGYHKWVQQDRPGIATLEAGEHALRAYYDEPNVLVDKVFVRRLSD